MSQKTISAANLSFCNDAPFVLLAGINVLESKELAFQVCEHLVNITAKHGIPYVFKASFDKANRSSIKSFRGPGMEEGLKLLSEIKAKFNVPVITDIHEPHQAAPVAEVADILQIPAFLCRQTELVKAASETGKVINVKKMQMMAPGDVTNIFKKFQEFGNDNLMICERGTSFGYNNLVVDPLAFPEMRRTGYPIIFDVTHSLQRPGGLGTATAGRGEYAEKLMLAGMSQSIAGLFLETHPDPSKAKCDGPCATPLAEAESMILRAKRMDELVKGEGF